MPGVQTAVVTGPVGETQYVDEMGRVKVKFPWDRSGSVTCSRNAAPLAPPEASRSRWDGAGRVD